MKNSNLLSAALAGTAAMTVFSYLLSGKKNKNFKEPKLLGKLISRGVPGIKKADAKLGGWVLHAATGLAFATGYKALFQQTSLQPHLQDAIGVGLLTGWQQ